MTDDRTIQDALCDAQRHAATAAVNLESVRVPHAVDRDGEVVRAHEALHVVLNAQQNAISELMIAVARLAAADDHLDGDPVVLLQAAATGQTESLRALGL